MTVAEGPMAVTYEGLPISSGGAHGLGRMQLREAYAKSERFVMANSVLTAARVQRFSIEEVPELPDPAAWVPAFRDQFGGGERRIPIADDQVDMALSFLESVDPQPSNRWGMAPLWFSTIWNFQVLDPATGKPFQGQDGSRYSDFEYDWRTPLGTSWATLTLSNRASFHIDLCLPDLNLDRLPAVIDALQATAPFQFARKHWRR